MTSEQKVWSSFRVKRGKELHGIKKMPVYFLTLFYKRFKVDSTGL